MNYERIKRIGTRAALSAGEIIKACIGHAEVHKKGDIDLVTEADTKAEAIILDTIRTAFPDHAILSEESGLECHRSLGGADDPKWIIDPLDGTTNFSHQLPIFSVSIAYSENGETKVGIVYCPVGDSLFTAIKGEGAFLNGTPMSVSQKDSVKESLLVTGFPYRFDNGFDELMERLGKCLKASQGIRRLGSAAVDLCYVAAGYFDGYWEKGIHPWDIAAGALIAMEAGARVTDFSGKRHSYLHDEILATNGIIHEDMLSLLKID